MTVVPGAPPPRFGRKQPDFKKRSDRRNWDIFIEAFARRDINGKDPFSAYDLKYPRFRTRKSAIPDCEPSDEFEP